MKRQVHAVMHADHQLHHADAASRSSYDLLDGPATSAALTLPVTGRLGRAGEFNLSTTDSPVMSFDHDSWMHFHPGCGSPMVCCSCQVHHNAFTSRV
jgi:hypothetical protein